MAPQARSSTHRAVRPTNQFCRLDPHLEMAKSVGAECAAQRPFFPAQLGETVDDLIGYPVGDKDCPHRRAHVLQYISEGMSLRAAANYAGITNDALGAWAETDPIFVAQIQEAQSDWHRRQARDSSASRLKILHRPK